jgi:murein L,D-transpeptidase YcbB/YkuD
MFNNKSSVYLHDTPVKWAFYKKMRAVSHGCVRLGDPQALALNLFGQGDKFKIIATDMAADNPSPTSINLPQKVPVYITYITCWPDENSDLQFRQDVYGLDIVLYDYLQRHLHPQVN